MGLLQAMSNAFATGHAKKFGEEFCTSCIAAWQTLRTKNPGMDVEDLLPLVVKVRGRMTNGGWKPVPGHDTRFRFRDEFCSIQTLDVTNLFDLAHKVGGVELCAEIDVQGCVAATAAFYGVLGKHFAARAFDLGDANLFPDDEELARRHNGPKKQLSCREFAQSIMYSALDVARGGSPLTRELRSNKARYEWTILDAFMVRMGCEAFLYEQDESVYQETIDSFVDCLVKVITRYAEGRDKATISQEIYLRYQEYGEVWSKGNDGSGKLPKEIAMMFGKAIGSWDPYDLMRGGSSISKASSVKQLLDSMTDVSDALY